MFDFGPCPSGLRKDCIQKVCLARHIDDTPTNTEGKVREILRNKAKNQSNAKRKYSNSTRSTRSSRRQNVHSPEAHPRADSQQKMKAFNARFDVPVRANNTKTARSSDEGVETPEKIKQQKEECSGKNLEYLATGLSNLRNTCYMNAVLQCLAHTQQIMGAISNKTAEEKGTLFDELKRLLTNITSGEYQEIAPRSFKEKVDKYLKDYAGYKQHDAHDFMCSLVEQLDKEVGNGTEELIKIFTGKSTIERKCTGCNEKAETVEDPFTSLHIEFKEDNMMKETRIEQVIEDLHKPENVDYPCTCGSNKSTRTMKIAELPSVLILQIKRFVHEKGSQWPIKNHTVVEYPKNLAVGKQQYELYAYIKHIGIFGGGHYQAVCKQDITDKWFCYDDHKAAEIKIDSPEKSSQAYILFYRKNEDRNNDVTMMEQFADISFKEQDEIESLEVLYDQEGQKATAEMGEKNETKQGTENHVDGKRGEKLSETLRKSTRQTTKSEKEKAREEEIIEREEKKKAEEVKRRKKEETNKEKEKEIDAARYCICNQTYNKEEHVCMIACDACDEWYHCKCIDFVCFKCEVKNKGKNKSKHETERIKLNTEVQNKSDEVVQLKNQLKSKREEEKKDKQEINTLNAKVQTLEKQNAKNQKAEEKEINKKMKEMETKHNKDLKNIQNKNSNLEERVAKKDEEIRTMEETTKELKTKITKMTKEKEEHESKKEELQLTIERLEQENKALKDIEADLKKLQQPEQITQNQETQDGEQPRGINALINLCEAKNKEIGEKDEQLAKFCNENKNLEKSNKEHKANLKKNEAKQQEIEADNEQLIKEKCSISKQALILEENNRTLRAIVSYLELEDVTRKSDGNEQEKMQREDMKSKSKRSKEDIKEADTTNPQTKRNGKDRPRQEKKEKKDEKREEKRDERPICWYYENTYCMFEEKCRNKHREDWEIDRDYRTRYNDRQYRKENHRKAESRRSKTDPKSQYCWWDENGKCSFGDECRNKHRDKGDKSKGRDQEEIQRNQENESKNKEREELLRILKEQDKDEIHRRRVARNSRKKEEDNMRITVEEQLGNIPEVSEEEQEHERYENCRDEIEQEGVEMEEQELESETDEFDCISESENEEKRNKNENQEKQSSIHENMPFLDKRVAQDQLYKEVMMSPWL